MGRLTNKLLVVFLCLFSISLFSQTNKDFSDIEISLKFENTSIKTIFDDITQKTGYTFVYSSGIFNDQQQISVEFTNTKLPSVITKVLSKQKLGYKVEGKQVIIVKKTGNSSTISGVVKDEFGSAMPGVNVVIAGTTIGTITDIDGRFQIIVKDANTKQLEVSSIGFKKHVTNINDETYFTVVLYEEKLSLDEVVVIGYGSMKKSDLTASISSVSSDIVEKTNSNDATQALQGRVAGVNVITSSGSPSASGQVIIRGIGTTGGNSPLYVIDGSPGNIGDVSQKDIASIEVLKDAAAAAIYGSRAANGVVIVTTKTGKKGETVVELSSTLSTTESIDKFDLLNAEQYKTLHKAMAEAAGDKLPDFVNMDTDVDTDWQDEVFRTAIKKTHDVAIRGGNDNLIYSLSGSMMENEGTLIGSDYQRNTLRANLGITKDRLKVTANIGYAEKKENVVKMGLKEVYEIAPLISSEKKSDGTYHWNTGDMPSHRNPLADDHFKENWKTSQNLTLGTKLEFTLTDFLKVKSNLNLININGHSFYNTQVYRKSKTELQEFIYQSESRNNYRRYLMENWLEFNHKFDKHKVNVIGGFTASEETNKWLTGSVDGYAIERTVEGGKIVETKKPAGFLDDSFKTLNAGKGGTYSAGGSETTYKRASILSRLNYSYDSKYLFQFTFRRDGSSKFGKDNRYGNFDSYALGWVLSEESFLKPVKAINFLKLRLSYGTLGSEEALGLYKDKALVKTSSTWWGGYVRGEAGNPWTGSYAEEMPNKDLKWEVSKTLNVGFDFTFLKNFSGAVNYYNKTTEDLLINKKLSPSAGLKDPTINVGEMVNKGFELELSYRNQIGDFIFDIAGTFSMNDNEVTELSNSDQELYNIVNVTKVGETFGSFYLYETDGIFQSDAEVQAHTSNVDGKDVVLQANAKPGDIRFKDLNGDGVISPDDRSVQGSGIPAYDYGLNLYAEYKGFDVTLFIQGVGGNKIFNGNRQAMEAMASSKNHLATTMNYWRPDNTNTSMPRAIKGDPNDNARNSDRFLEDGDYLRLKNVQIGYTIPAKFTQLVGVNNCRVYASGHNIFTITDYSGLDPEVSGFYGYDRTAYPMTRTFMVGVNLKF